MRGQISLQIPAFNSLGCIPISGIAKPYHNSILNFQRNYFLHYFKFPPTVHKSLNFSTSPSIFIFLFFLYSCHPNESEVTFHCGLTSISLIISDPEHLLISLLVIYISSKRNIYQVLYHFCNWYIWVLLICSSLFWILIAYQIYDLQIFSTILRGAFSLFCLWLLMHKSSEVWWNLIYLYLLLLPLLWCHIQKSLPNPTSLKIFAPMFSSRSYIVLGLSFRYFLNAICWRDFPSPIE